MAREGRRFAFAVGGALLVLAAVAFWRGHYIVPLVLAKLGEGLILVGVIAPGRLWPVSSS